MLDRLAGYGQTAELHALMAHGASMGISRGVTTLLDELAEVKPTLLYAVPQLFKRVCDAIHAKVRTSPEAPTSTSIVPFVARF